MTVFVNNGSCFDWSFSHHHCQSILVGVGGQKGQNNGLVTSACHGDFTTKVTHKK